MMSLRQYFGAGVVRVAEMRARAAAHALSNRNARQHHPDRKCVESAKFAIYRRARAIPL